MRVIREKVDATNSTVSATIALLKELAAPNSTKALTLPLTSASDARKSDQNVRGATSAARGTGRSVRVAVFAGPSSGSAKAAGAGW